MDKSGLDLLLKGRAIIDAHRNRPWQTETDEQHTESTLKMYAGLKELGFDSLDKFSTFNNLSCYDEYKDKTKIEGFCDQCIGLNDTPSCVKRYGDKACYYAPEKIVVEDIYKNWWKHRQKKTLTLKIDTSTHARIYSGRPEGCGFYADFSKQVFDFDVDWKV